MVVVEIFLGLIWSSSTLSTDMMFASPGSHLGLGLDKGSYTYFLLAAAVKEITNKKAETKNILYTKVNS